MKIEITVFTLPVAQPRQRHRVVKDRAGRRRLTNYTPKTHPVNTFKAAIQLAATQEYKGPLLTGPLSVGINFLFPRPKNKMWKRKEMPREWKTSKPDIDNIQKSVYDALKGIFWADDSQICSNYNAKMICGGMEKPFVNIIVQTLDEE